MAGSPGDREGLLDVDGLAVAGLALVAYLLRIRGECVGDGGMYLGLHLLGLIDDHTTHFLVYRTLDVAELLASGLGASLHDTAVALQSLGAAFFVYCTHAFYRAAGGTRMECLAGALWIAVVPSVLFYATAFELHGVFLGFAGAAFLAARPFVREPTVVRGAWVGVVAGIAYLAHASAILLPGLVGATSAACIAARRGEGLRGIVRLVPHVAVVVATGLVATVLALAVVGALGYVTSLGAMFERAEAYLGGAGSNGARFPPRDVVVGIWNEWVLPFSIASVLWWIALLRRRLRVLAVVLAVCIVVHVAPTLAVIHGLVERGSYVLPVTVLLVWTCVRSLPAKAWLPCIVATAAVALTAYPSERPAGLARAGRAIAPLVERHAFFVLWDVDEAEPFVLHSERAEWFPLCLLADERAPDATRVSRTVVEAICAKLEEGRPVVMTARAHSVLRGAEPGSRAAAIFRALCDACRLERGADDRFPHWRVGMR